MLQPVYGAQSEFPGNGGLSFGYENTFWNVESTVG